MDWKKTNVLVISCILFWALVRRYDICPLLARYFFKDISLSPCHFRLHTASGFAIMSATSLNILEWILPRPIDSYGLSSFKRPQTRPSCTTGALTCAIIVNLSCDLGSSYAGKDKEDIENFCLVSVIKK